MMGLLPVSIEGLSVFTAAAVALALAPGPDNIFVLTVSEISRYPGGNAAFVIRRQIPWYIE